MSRQLLALLLAGLLSACTVGPDYKHPQREYSSGWNSLSENDKTASTAEAPDLRLWWTRFSDPKLDSLIARARAHHSESDYVARLLELYAPGV